MGTTRDDADAAAASIRRQLLIGIPSALLLAAVLGYLIAGAGLRPIERMREHAASSRRDGRPPDSHCPLPGTSSTGWASPSTRCWIASTPA